MNDAGNSGSADPAIELAQLRRANARLQAELGRRQQEAAALEIGRAALQTSERRLRDTLESTDAGFLLIDRHWSVIDLNQRAAQMAGRPPARIIGRSVFELWPDDVGERLATVLRRAMTERQPETVLHHSASQGGGGGVLDRWFEVRVFPAAQGLTIFFRDASAQEQARQRLLQAETSARLAIQAARLGTWSYEPPSGRLTWDARHRALFGIAETAEIDIATLLGGVHPDDRGRIAAALQAASDPAGGGEIVQEYRSIDAGDGRERWLSTMGQAQFAGGVCVRLDGVVQDVTDRRRAEAALAESEQRFRAIAEALPGIVFVTDAAGENTYVNPQFSVLVGRPVAELLGLGWLDIVHPADRPRSQEQWQEIVRAGLGYQVEQRFRRADGAYRWFLCRGVPVREPMAAAPGEGRIVQWFGTATDIQDLVEARQVLARDREVLEQRVAERTRELQTTLERLRQEEARLRAIFDHSSECLFLLRVDPERGPVFLDVNPPAEAMLGQPRDRLVGVAPQELSQDPSDRQARDADLEAALRPGAGPHRYVARRHYNGREQLFDAVAVALDGPQGERLILVTARDITDQRALEEALRQSHKMEAIGQLTGGIAHDFNNLLTGISGSLELIRARVAQGRAGEVDRYAEAALESVRRGAALTHRLLAFARRQALEPQKLDLNRLVTDMHELIGRTVGPGVSIETVLAPDLWPTLCDANQMENALLNLCLNARDAMPQGGRMRIATSNVPADPTGGGARADAVAVAVSDTGTGMPAEIAARAFEPFFTTKPAGQGTGLGLAMVYGFVRQSGGQISLRSEPGRGTEIGIELPRCVEAPSSPAGDASVSPAATGPQPSQTILLVEDEPLVRELAAEALGGLGYRVVQAGDAGAALRVLQDGAAIDLLLTDVGLPGMSGQELVEAARALRPALKVLFVTGFVHEAGGEVGLIGPGMALLGKPFGLAALARKVEALLST